MKLSFYVFLLLLWPSIILPMEQTDAGESMQNPFQLLPDEVVLEIFSHAFNEAPKLQKTYDSIALTDKRFNRLVNNKSIFDRRKELLNQLSKEFMDQKHGFLAFLFSKESPSGIHRSVIAIRYNFFKVIEAEIKKDPAWGFKRDEYRKSNIYLSHEIAQYGQIEVINYLFSRFPGLIIEKKDNGSTVLHTAVRYQNRPVIIAILNSYGKCGLNEQDSRGQTPLHLAAINNDHETMRMLLDKGADNTITDHLGREPADYLSKRSDT